MDNNYRTITKDMDFYNYIKFDIDDVIGTDNTR